MRPSMFGKFDREVYYREPPARRLAVILSSLFLLSLTAVAALTTLQARGGEQDAARIHVIALTQTATH